MNDFFNQMILGNSVKAYCILAGILLLALLFQNYLSRWFAKFLHRLFIRLTANVDREEFTFLIIKPLKLFFILMVFIIAISNFHFPERLNIKFYSFHLKNITHGLLKLLFIVSITWILLRIMDVLALILKRHANLNSRQSEQQFIVFFRDFFKAILVLVGILFVLSFVFDRNMGKLLAGLGIGAAALALASQETLQNLIGSFIIFFDKPFMVGDVITVNGMTGTIEKIGLRSTKMRSVNQTFVTVPNKQIVDNILDNLTLMIKRRATISLELSLGAQTSKIIPLVRDISGFLKTHNDIEKGFTVNFDDLVRGAMIIQIIYVSPILDWNTFCALKEEVNINILKLMEKHEITLASGVKLEQS